jgi:predicted O-methyltransferase YrrM
MMAATLPSLSGRGDRVSMALRHALRDTALGRLPGEERAWAERIEANRRRLPRAAVGIAARDPGAPQRNPSEHLAEAERACEWMGLPQSWGRLLTRVVRELSPRSCLELGTGFGVSTAYQAAALELNGAGRLVSLDIPNLTAIAAPSLERLGLSHRVELVGGLIEETLPGACELAAPIDYVFLDADHTEGGTLRPFDALIPHLADGATVVFDDINWTAEMRGAWRLVRERPRVNAAFGVHRLGIAVVGSSEGSPR